MVETHFARSVFVSALAAAFRIRIRHRANTVLVSHQPLFFFFLSTTLKYRRQRANTHVARRQRHRSSRFSLSSHLSYAEEGCYVNVKLCID